MCQAIPRLEILLEMNGLYADSKAKMIELEKH